MLFCRSPSGNVFPTWTSWVGASEDAELRADQNYIGGVGASQAYATGNTAVTIQTAVSGYRVAASLAVISLGPAAATTTAAPTVAGVAIGPNVLISSDTDMSTGLYPVATSVAGHLHIHTNPGLTTMDNAFPRLTRIDWHLQIDTNANLGTLGDAFPVLVELGTNSGGISLYVHTNAALQSLGTAFASLRRIPGTLYFDTNPLLANFDALSNLECHGGAYNNDPATYCQGCPAWLLAKPRC